LSETFGFVDVDTIARETTRPVSCGYGARWFSTSRSLSWPRSDGSIHHFYALVFLLGVLGIFHILGLRQAVFMALIATLASIISSFLPWARFPSLSRRTGSPFSHFW